MPYRSLPSLPSLRAFECVARHGSFKEASKELFVTPGALSQLVKKLEEELERDLFVRGHRNIQLTEDGKTLIVGLQRGFSLLKESVDALRAKEKDVLNIAAPPSIISKFIIPKLNGFLASHPHLDVHFSMEYDHVNYWERDIDVGIRLSGDVDPSMCVTSLSKERYVIAASPSLVSQYQLHISANIGKAPLIEASHVLNAEHELDWAHVMAQHGFTDCSGLRRLNFGPCLDKAIDAAVANAGVLICPFRLIENELATRKLTVVLAESIPSKNLEYQAVCVAEKQKNPHIKAFLNWLQIEFRTSPTEITAISSECVA